MRRIEGRITAVDAYTLAKHGDVQLVIRCRRSDLAGVYGMREPRDRGIELAEPVAATICVQGEEPIALEGGPNTGWIHYVAPGIDRFTLPDGVNLVPYRDGDGDEKLGLGQCLYRDSKRRDGEGRRIFQHILTVDADLPAGCGPSPLKPLFDALADPARSDLAERAEQLADDPSQAPDADEKAAMERFFFGG